MRRVAVVGAGAAGTMAAIFAASAGAATLLLEGTKDGGRKILISGGGRCNILPARLDESRFVTESSPAALRRILRSWPLADQIAFFERDLDLPLVEEPASGKLFPRSGRARDVRDRLLAFARGAGVTLAPGSPVTDLSPSPAGWRIERARGDAIEADAVILATGGLSVPATGSDGWGLRIAGRLGHAVNPTYAALTPIVAEGDPDFARRFAGLSGISLPVRLTARSPDRRAAAAGGFLFTHRGYSGPAVLDVSHVAVRSPASAPDPARLSVQWTPRGDDEWIAALRPDGARTALAAVSAVVPHRLAQALIAHAGLDPALPLSQLRRGDRRRLVDGLVRTPLPWTSDEGYRKAEVTGGGVSLSEIDPRTLESRRHRGLFLCGEMLDVFGPIGGYNFLWAWASGRAAGLGAARAAPGVILERCP